ncbi:MAG: hypothetical protein AAF741_06880 [Bacteroidota bacterium]
MKIIEKKVAKLTPVELEQLEALIYRYYKSASPKFIANRLEKDHGYDIVMLKEGDTIQGVNFYHLTKHKVGHWRRTNYILHFGQVMKRSGYRGNIIWTHLQDATPHYSVWYTQAPALELSHEGPKGPS